MKKKPITPSHSMKPGVVDALPTCATMKSSVTRRALASMMVLSNPVEESPI
jgi:hypothetical protein